MAQFGVSRGLAGDYPEDYNDTRLSYTPAWQEQWTGVSKETVIKFARVGFDRGEERRQVLSDHRRGSQSLQVQT
ncbi:MAG: hypothetical protein AABN34_07090 [Acidobacteriota bacterium]